MTDHPTPDQNAPQLVAGKSSKAILLFIITTALLLSFDLISKSLAFEKVANEPVVLSTQEKNTQADLPNNYQPIVVWENVLELKLVVNDGAVFGIGSGKRGFFLVVGCIALAFIGTFFYKSPANGYGLHLCLAFILSGALGNIYDRFLYGVVRDLLHLFPGVELPFGWSWGPEIGNQVWPWIFNVADVFLLIGVFSLMILSWRSEQADKQQQNDQTAPD